MTVTKTTTKQKMIKFLSQRLEGKRRERENRTPKAKRFTLEEGKRLGYNEEDTESRRDEGVMG